MDKKKIVFFAFSGEKSSFMHILLNAVDMQEKGNEVKVVIEGQATKLVQTFIEEEIPIFKKALNLNIIDSICKACSEQCGVLEYNQKTGIPINGDLMGHPPMNKYIEDNYQIIVL